MKTHISIMAHAEVKDTFKRHFPYWSAQVQDVEKDMLIWFPEKSTFEVGGVQTMAICKKEHHGVEAIKRFRYMLEHLNGLGYDRYVFHEYDSLTFGDLPENTGQFAANWFGETSHASFIGRFYCHPPLVFSAKGLAMIVDELRHMPEQENGYWDRYIGLAAERSGVIMYGFMEKGLGYAHNTIHESQYPDLRRSILRGARSIHGCKEKSCFEVAEKAYKDAEEMFRGEATRKELLAS